MSQTIEVKVPDIGGFKGVAVIEIAVKAGDEVSAEQSLITLETDKAAMEVPAPVAGIVKEMKVKIGDKVSEGSVILMLETASTQAAAASQSVAAPLDTPTAPIAAASPASAVPSTS